MRILGTLFGGLIVGLILLVSATGQLLGQDSSNHWSQFRGHNGQGTQVRCSVPMPWKDSDIRWTLSLQGNGNASPVMWGNTVYLASAKGSERFLEAIDVRNGKSLWHKSFPLSKHKLHTRNSFASGTPCLDSDGVYLAYGDPEKVTLVALDHLGNQRWERDLGSFVSQHGFGGSPVVHDGIVIFWVSQDAEQLPADQEPGDSRVMAFDSKSGRTLWTTSRIATRTCYGTPTLYQAQSGPALLFANTAEGIFSLDLKSGKPLWNRQVFAQRSVSSPIIVGDLAIATEGSGAGNNVLFAVNMHGDHEQVFSRNKSIPYVPTPVVRDNLMFLWSDKGIVTCLKMPDNEILWSERINGNVYSSPVVAGDKLLGIAEDGNLTILSASERFNLIGTIPLGETTRATPLISDKFLLIRTDTKLICVGDPT